VFYISPAQTKANEIQATDGAVVGIPSIRDPFDEKNQVMSMTRFSIQEEYLPSVCYPSFIRLLVRKMSHLLVTSAMMGMSIIARIRPSCGGVSTCECRFSLWFINTDGLSRFFALDRYVTFPTTTKDFLTEHKALVQ
jgi:hypothetical protein